MLPITIRRQVEAERTWGVGSGEWGVHALKLLPYNHQRRTATSGLAYREQVIISLHNVSA